MRKGAPLQNTALHGETQSYSRGESSKGDPPCQGGESRGAPPGSGKNDRMESSEAMVRATTAVTRKKPVERALETTTPRPRDR